MKSKKLTKATKQLLPGIQAKVLKPVATLVSPQQIVVPIVLTGIIAQVNDNLKDVHTPKDVQQLESVRNYSKCLGIGDSRQLSATHALANTLGPEAQKLASLPPDERENYLRELCHTINTIAGPAKVKASSLVLQNENELAAHRRGLALQCRSNMQATPIYNKTQMTIGIAIKELDLEIAIDSAKQLWTNLGREAEEFDSLLVEQVADAPTVTEAVISIVKRNLVTILKEDEDGSIIHGGDVYVLKGEDNLTPIERNLGFIQRLTPKVPEAIEITPDVKVDPILQAALDQQKSVATAVTTTLQKAGKTPKGNKAAKPPAKAESKTSTGKGSRRRTQKQ